MPPFDKHLASDDESLVSSRRPKYSNGFGQQSFAGAHCMLASSDNFFPDQCIVDPNGFKLPVIATSCYPLHRFIDPPFMHSLETAQSSKIVPLAGVMPRHLFQELDTLRDVFIANQ
jgi:hypothetical protein